MCRVLARDLAHDAQSVSGAIITRLSLLVAIESRSETRLGCQESSASKSSMQSGILVRASWNETGQGERAFLSQFTVKQITKHFHHVWKLIPKKDACCFTIIVQ